MMGDLMGGWGWISALCGIFMILFLALIILGAAALARSLFPRGNSAGSGGGRPLDMLRERYARGEITDDQYHQALRGLES